MDFFLQHHTYIHTKKNITIYMRRDINSVKTYFF